MLVKAKLANPAPAGGEGGVAAGRVVGHGGHAGLTGCDDRRGGRGGGRAPAVVTAKLTTPPSTGSTGLLAVTVTASGLANAVPTAADCGVLPATAVRAKPWLWKAPMSTAGQPVAARAGRWPGRRWACHRRWRGCPGAGRW